MRMYYILNKCININMTSTDLETTITEFSTTIAENNADCLDKLESIVSTGSEIIAVMLLLAGGFIIKKLKDKKIEATTNFYARFKIHLLQFKEQLGTEKHTVLNYLYSPNTPNVSLPNIDDLNKFQAVLKDLLDFLKSTDNQVIPSENFFKNQKELLNILMKYTLIPNYHPYSEIQGEQVETELLQVRDLIDNLVCEIEKEQTKLHRSFWNKNKN